MTAPRIPRHRPAVIPCCSPRWYELTPLRVGLIVCIALAAWLAWAALAVLFGAAP